jgi:hypothetical protein
MKALRFRRNTLDRLARSTRACSTYSALEEAIKEAEVAVDHHTIEMIRNKRKSMQERRNTRAQQMKLVSQNAPQGQHCFNYCREPSRSLLSICVRAQITAEPGRHLQSLTRGQADRRTHVRRIHARGRDTNYGQQVGYGY